MTASIPSSELGLGTVQWGMPYGVANDSGMPAPDTVRALLRRAGELGIRTLDTARAYGHSEALIGDALRGSSGFHIVTKLDPNVCEPDTAPDLAEERTLRSVGESLAQLRLTRLETLLLHRAAHRTAAGGAVWRTLRARRREGTIGRLGVSAATPEEACALVEDAEIEALQVAASLFDRRLERSGFFARAAALRKTVFVRSVFLQGAAHLNPNRLPAHLEAIRDPLRRVHEFAAAYRVSAPEVFIAYAKRRLPGTTVIVGCETLEQLEGIARAWSSDALDDEAVRALSAQMPLLPTTVLDPSLWPR